MRKFRRNNFRPKQTDWLSPPSSHIRIGHNKGPSLHTGWNYFCWKKSHAKAFANPPPEVMRRRLKRAAELGMTYREYTSIVLDTGKNP
jgi:hypothetical protein